MVDPARENTCKELTGQDDLFQREGQYAVRINDEFAIDVMPAACGHRFQELAAFIEHRDLDDVQLPLMSLAGLLLTKEGMREKDRADRRVLEQALAALASPI